MCLARAWLGFAALVLAHAAPRDIIMVVVDDLGWGDVGFHSRELAGGGDIKTPVIDRFADAGVQLGT